MAKRHDENNDLRSFGRISSFNVVTKTLRASKAVVIGIRMWGKIDYLVNYCGYHFVWDNTAKGVAKVVSENVAKSNARAAKKAAKEHKLTDKRK
nr:MAG TPA: hypothetical protein [Crassvirales sp.]